MARPQGRVPGAQLLQDACENRALRLGHLREPQAAVGPQVPLPVAPPLRAEDRTPQDLHGEVQGAHVGRELNEAEGAGPEDADVRDAGTVEAEVEEVGLHALMGPHGMGAGERDA
jgi:hypothetical protein